MFIVAGIDRTRKWKWDLNGNLNFFGTENSRYLFLHAASFHKNNNIFDNSLAFVFTHRITFNFVYINVRDILLLDVMNTNQLKHTLLGNNDIIQKNVLHSCQLKCIQIVVYLLATWIYWVFMIYSPIVVIPLRIGRCLVSSYSTVYGGGSQHKHHGGNTNQWLK